MIGYGVKYRFMTRTPTIARQDRQWRSVQVVAAKATMQGDLCLGGRSFSLPAGLAERQPEYISSKLHSVNTAAPGGGWG
jgi:hypothetical protein